MYNTTFYFSHYFCIFYLVKPYKPFKAFCVWLCLLKNIYILQTLDAELLDMKKEKEVRRQKVKQHFDDLVSNSTLHGLHFCFDKQHFFRRIFWTLLILVALGLLVQKLYESTTYFFSYPFSTTTTVKYVNQMVFPAVSICNLNDFRLSVMNGTKLHKAIQERGNILALDGKEYTDTIRKANHRLEDMLQGCIMNNKVCSHKNFTQFFHNQGDRCFTFNSGMDEQPLITVNNTGLSQALTFLINIEHHDYYVDSQHSGIHLILHGQDETPVKMQGVILSPGFVSYIEIKKRKVRFNSFKFLQVHILQGCSGCCNQIFYELYKCYFSLVQL